MQRAVVGLVDETMGGPADEQLDAHDRAQPGEPDQNQKDAHLGKPPSGRKGGRAVPKKARKSLFHRLTRPAGTPE